MTYPKGGEVRRTDQEGKFLAVDVIAVHAGRAVADDDALFPLMGRRRLLRPLVRSPRIGHELVDDEQGFACDAVDNVVDADRARNVIDEERGNIGTDDEEARMADGNPSASASAKPGARSSR